jgi:hypothetical protein
MLSLIKAIITPKYRKTWNIGKQDDYVYLAKDGVKISDQLYREGSIDVLKQTKYFTLLKQVEDYYSDNITNKPSEKKHLSNRTCILDNNGVEKFVSKFMEYPYIINNSCIFHIGKNYYNIETKELYCSSYNSVESFSYLFLQMSGTKNLVMKIDKNTGISEVIR